MTTLQAILFIIAAVLMFLAAVRVTAGRADLATLAWAFAILAFALPVIDAAF